MSLGRGITLENGMVVWRMSPDDARELSYKLEQFPSSQGWREDGRMLFELADEAKFGAPEWCPVCHAYHANPGVKTDAGALVKQCPRLSPGDPRNSFTS